MFMHPVNSAFNTALNALFSIRSMTERPIDVVLRKMSERGLTQTGLAGLMGVLPQDITNWKSRGLPHAKLGDAAEALGCSVDELLGRVAGEKPGTYVDTKFSLAHALSHTKFDHPPTVKWEDIMQNGPELPVEFECAVPDGALSPLTPKGTRLLFATAAAPAPGLGVLVEDGDGFRYIRRYVQGAGDRWLAAASHRDYANLDSVDNRLKILAVATGRMDGSV